MSYKATKGIIALTHEIDYDQTAMGSPPHVLTTADVATSALFLIAD
jgi:hypothetical protein